MPANGRGRDFILSDLHGHREALDVVLSRAKFDFQKDRLFFVGDFTDRGPKNVECLQLLNEPWLFPVLGNHDFNLMLAGFLGEANEGEIPRDVRGMPDGVPPWDVWAFLCHYGGRWVGDMTPKGWKLLREVAILFQAMPHLRIIGDGGDRFHVVHAGLHPQEIILSSTAATDSLIDSGIWGVPPAESALGMFTRRYNRNTGFDGKGLSTTYCGHSVVRQITRFAQHVNIDTGCGKGGDLTLVCHQTQEAWSVTA